MNKYNQNDFDKAISEHLKLTKILMQNEFGKISRIVNILIKTIKNKGTIFWCGNGGSAADSQHLNAELIGRFEKERLPIRSHALTTDTSVITALSNDYDYKHIFSRQIKAYCKKNDAVIFISTSGNSRNIIEGLKQAKKIGCKKIALLGNSGGKAKKISDISLIINSKKTARIQEMHILVGHLVCMFLEKKVFN